MATRFRTKFSAQIPSWQVPPLTFRDMVVTIGADISQGMNALAAIDANGERSFAPSGLTLPHRFYSERIADEVTISGTITFNVWANKAATALGRLRARLYKVTAGGSDVETLIAGPADAAADITTSSAVYNFTATPSVPVVVSPGERLILHITVTPVGGSFGTGAISIFYGKGGAAGLGDTYVEATEAVNIVLNVRKMILRRTTDAGIGNFFDLLDVLGSTAFTTGVVNTAAAGTEIQWTRTAGGTVLEWISPRMKITWRTELASEYAPSGLISPIWAFESNALANCALRVKLFRRQPDGTELLTYTKDTPELPIAAASQVMTGGTLAQPTDFAEDDRLVLRLYIVNVGTMAAGHTCTCHYDHNVTGTTSVNGNAYLSIMGGPLFKAESEPDAGLRASNLATGGVGN